MAEFTLIQFRKPLDVTVESLMDDSEYFIETFLKAYPLNRYFGYQSVRITSLGEVDQVQTQDLQEYLNYVFYSYGGTFNEWTEYLTLDFPKPPAFDGLKFSYTDALHRQYSDKDNSSAEFPDIPISIIRKH